MPSVRDGAIVADVIPSVPLGTDAAARPPGPAPAQGAVGLAGADGQRRFHFELAAHPGSPAQARRLTRTRLTGWSVCEDTCDTAALVVSELVTNAIMHTASRHIVCELQDGGELVRIAVRDEGRAPGQPRANTRHRPEEEHGRGLLLVDTVCHAWGAHEHGPGLLVWAELLRTAGTPHPHNDLGWGERPRPGRTGGRDDPEEPGQRHHSTGAASASPRSPRPHTAPHRYRRDGR